MLSILKEFARRALGKIDNLARWERENDVPASRQTQKAFREASIKAGTAFTRLPAPSCVLSNIPSSLFTFSSWGFLAVNVSVSQLAAVLFKRLVFENGKRPKAIFKAKTKSAVKDPAKVRAVAFGVPRWDGPGSLCDSARRSVLV